MQAQMTLRETQNLAILIVKFFTETTQVDRTSLPLLRYTNKPLWANPESNESYNILPPCSPVCVCRVRVSAIRTGSCLAAYWLCVANCWIECART